MSTEFFRKYIDIVNENQQSEVLTEGMIDTIVQKTKQVIGKIPDDLRQKVTDFVANALGKPADQISMSDLNMDSINKVIAANKSLNEDGFWKSFTNIKDPELNSATKIGGILGALASSAAIGFMFNSSQLAGQGPAILKVVAIAAIAVAIFARMFNTKY